jgi:hypothetical protein
MFLRITNKIKLSRNRCLSALSYSYKYKQENKDINMNNLYFYYKLNNYNKINTCNSTMCYHCKGSGWITSFKNNSIQIKNLNFLNFDYEICKVCSGRGYI